MGKIRLRHGESEIELEGDEDFIERQLASFYKKFQIDLRKQTTNNETPENPQNLNVLVDTSQNKPTPAEFFIRTANGRTDGATQLLVFAKYLDTYEKISEFSAKQINGLVSRAKLSKDIHPQYFSNAVKDGLLRSDAPGKFSLTLSGESKIETFANSKADGAMPTRKSKPKKKPKIDSDSKDEKISTKKRQKATSIALEKFDPHSDGDKPSLEEFFKSKETGASSGEKLAIIAYYITHIKGAESFSEGNIDYAFRTLKLKNRPAHLRQVLINNKNNHDLFDQSGAKWVLTRTGMLMVEDRLPRDKP